MRVYYKPGSVPSGVQKALQQQEQQTAALKLVKGNLSLADIKDSPQARRFAVTQVDRGGQALVNYASPNRAQKFANLQGTSVDPTNINQVIARGSTPSTTNGTIAYTSTTTSITMTWTGLVIYRADGSTTTIPNGSTVFTTDSNGNPIASSTMYWFAPYWSEANSAVQWAGGAFISASQSLANGQLMNAQFNVPLSAGSFSVTTPASGSGTGHAGGGLNGCLHASQFVLTDTGMKESSDLTTDDSLWAPGEWQPIQTIEKEECGDWVRITFSDGEQVEVTETQPFYLGTGDAIQAAKLESGDVLMGDNGELKVVSRTGFKEDSFKVIVTIKSPHVFYLYKNGPLVHNGTEKP